METYEVIMNKGFGEPVYVLAEDPFDAQKRALGAYRKRCTSLDFWPADTVVKEVRLCTRKAVQYS